MRAPNSRIGQFVFFFFAQLVSYFLIVANTRAFTHDNYLGTIVTDGIISAQSFFLGKMSIENTNARSWAAFVGNCLGGVAGSVLAIFITKRFY